MTAVTLQFHGDLTEFFPNRPQPITLTCNGRQTIKHLISALHIPPTEVDALIHNNGCLTFQHIVTHQETIHIYPYNTPPPIPQSPPLHPPLPQPPCFLLDNHLGKLARYLRLLGLDTAYPRAHLDDGELAQIAHDENRIMLTRDRGLLMRRLIIHGYLLRTTNPHVQLTAVIHRFQLQPHMQPWSRCLRCNGLLQPIAKETIYNQLEPKTQEHFHAFQICTDCQQIYWPGSHFHQLNALVNEIYPAKA